MIDDIIFNLEDLFLRSIYSMQYINLIFYVIYIICMTIIILNNNKRF